MADTIDVTEKIAFRDKPKPPAWPDPGTPEFEERLARMRAGHAARRAKLEAKKAQAEPTEPEIIDVGKPKNVRMAPPEEPEKPKRGKKGQGEFQETVVRQYLTLGLDWLKSQPGHEHWHRDEDELRLVTVPATNCLNKIDPVLLEKLKSVSDPAALIFGCVMVFGPSLALEIKNAKAQQPAVVSRRQVAPRAPAPQPERAADETGDWLGGGAFPATPAVPSNGAQPIPVPPDLPLSGV